MNSSIQESLPENCVLELDSYLNELSLEKLEILLEQLMECIIFSLNCGEGDIVSFQYRYINIKMCSSVSQAKVNDLCYMFVMDVSFLPACISNI